MLATISSTKITQGNVQKGGKHLILLVFLEVANYIEWGAPSFAKPKPKSN